jgi:hypothetical protein
MEESENKPLTRVREEFNILDCIKTVLTARAEIKVFFINACWKPSLPRMVKSKREEDNEV